MYLKGSEGESRFRERHLPQQGHQLPRGALQAEGKALKEALKANVHFDLECVSKL